MEIKEPTALEMYTEYEAIALTEEPKPLEVDNRTQDSTEGEIRECSVLVEKVESVYRRQHRSFSCHPPCFLHQRRTDFSTC